MSGITIVYRGNAVVVGPWLAQFRSHLGDVTAEAEGPDPLSAVTALASVLGARWELNTGAVVTSDPR